MKNRILMIDDDEALAMITTDMLESYGYQTTWVPDGNAAYELLETQTFHVIILDINLPYENGFEICQELRKVSKVPIIFCSARTSEDDRIKGLDIGGDDYLAKPYSLKELLSRVKALIRRAYGYEEQEQRYQIGDVEINVTARSVKKEGELVSLSLKEFDLLAYMAEHQNTALKKETLLQEVWGTYSQVEVSTVSVHIRWLREKLEADPSSPEYIKTVWGVGYMLAGSRG